MTAIEAHQLQPGQIVSGFRIERQIGSGGMGVVYQATHIRLDRPVALKILTSERARYQMFVVNFFREARAAAQMSHQNIVQAYDAGLAEEGVYYLAMEYVQGETLQDRIDREGTVNPDQVLVIASAIAEALDYGWQQQGLIHGDIKPANIMIDGKGVPKLADFGLAKLEGFEDDGDSKVLLTPRYAAPEVIMGEHEHGDCRADIYSFGAMLYHALAGTPPFRGSDGREVMRKHLSETAVPLAERLSETVSAELSRFVMDLLAKDPDDRPQDWATVCGRLLLLRGKRPSRRKRPALRRQGAVMARTATAVRLQRRQVQRRGVLPWVLLAMFSAGLGMAFVFAVAGVNAPPPPAVEQSTPDEARRQEALREWENLQSQLKRVSDPALCLAILHTYGKRYELWAPIEYHEALRRYRAAAAEH